MPNFLWNPDTDDYRHFDDSPYDDDYRDDVEDEDEDYDDLEDEFNFTRDLGYQVQQLLSTNAEARKGVEKRILENYPYISSIGDMVFNLDTTQVVIHYTRPDGSETTESLYLFALLTIEDLISTLGRYLNIPKSSSSFKINKNT